VAAPDKCKVLTTEYVLDLYGRVVAMESFFLAHVSNDREALVLAKKQTDAEVALALRGLESHLHGLNQSKERMDKLEGSFATKDDLIRDMKTIEARLLAEKEAVTESRARGREAIDTRINSIGSITTVQIDNMKRTIYIGVGIALAISVLLPILFHLWSGK
jgi:hypothetical protein